MEQWRLEKRKWFVEFFLLKLIESRIVVTTEQHGKKQAKADCQLPQKDLAWVSGGRRRFKDVVVKHMSYRCKDVPNVEITREKF